ncbi:MAG: 50S ribosomal protein L24 [Patescibacteria group bacterium]
MKIKKGDTIKILTGKDKGKTGKVIRVDAKTEKITVEGLNIYKKHARPKRKGEKGQMVEVVRPIYISNAALVCHSCHKAVRVAYQINEGRKIRYCRSCKSQL